MQQTAGWTPSVLLLVLSASRLLAPHFPLLVPAPFLSSGPLHGMAFPFLSIETSLVSKSNFKTFLLLLVFVLLLSPPPQPSPLPLFSFFSFLSFSLFFFWNNRPAMFFSVSCCCFLRSLFQLGWSIMYSVLVYCVRGPVCESALRKVFPDQIFRFINTLIITIYRLAWLSMSVPNGT